MHRHSDRQSRGLLALLPVLILGSIPAADTVAQDDDQARRQGIFIDSVDVSLINLEVRASAKDGTPITDLTMADFEIFDDGKPVEITNFYRISGGRRVQHEAVGETLPDLPVVSSRAEERSSVVVLVDQSFLSLGSRQRVFDALGRKLDELMENGVEVMVASKDLDIRVEQELTPDRQRIDAVLARLSKTVTRSVIEDERRLVSEIQSASTSGTASFSAPTPPGGLSQEAQGQLGAVDTEMADARRSYSQVRGMSEQMLSEVRRSVVLLRRFLGSLAGLPGRKAMLYVADELPLRPGEEAWRLWYRQYARFGSELGVPSPDAMVVQYDASEYVREMIAVANANRVAFYPIGGGRATGMDAAVGGSRPTGGSGIRSNAIANAGLRWLASGTGGQAAVGPGAHLEFFDRMRADLEEFYSLAYASPHRGDGVSHRIEVRVKRPGVTVRYLDSYRDKSRDQEIEDRTLAALLLGVADNPLDVRVTVDGDSAKPNKDGHYSVPVEIRFPLSNLVLLPEEQAHVGKVSIHIIVRDEKGRMSDPVRIPLPIEIPHDRILQAMTQSAVYATKMTMRGGVQTIAVGVHDDIGSIGSTLNLDFRVGKESPGDERAASD